MTASQRRPTTLIERSTPCQCCAFPFSQRHHRFGVARYGENEFTVQLCPNCHRIYHLIDEADRGNKESQKLLGPLMHDNKLRDRYFLPLFRLHQDLRVVESADQHRRELLERDREEIQRRIQAGDSWGAIAIEYWDKVGVDPESLHTAMSAVQAWVNGDWKGPLAMESELRNQAVNELTEEWVRDWSKRPDGQQAIHAAIEQRMNEIIGR